MAITEAIPITIGMAGPNRSAAPASTASSATNKIKVRLRLDIGEIHRGAKAGESHSVATLSASRAYYEVSAHPSMPYGRQQRRRLMPLTSTAVHVARTGRAVLRSPHWSHSTAGY